MYLCKPCLDEIRPTAWDMYVGGSYGACEKCWVRGVCRDIPDSQLSYWEKIDSTTDTPTQPQETSIPDLPLMADATTNNPIISLPTQEEDIFQHIGIGEDQEFIMRVNIFPGWAIHVLVRNRRTHVVDLYEQFIIGAGKMGCQDIQKRGDNPLDDTVTYVMNDGARDAEGACEIEVWAELEIK